MGSFLGAGEVGAVCFVRIIRTVLHFVADRELAVLANATGAFSLSVVWANKLGAIGLVGAISTVVSSIADVGKGHALSVFTPNWSFFGTIVTIRFVGIVVAIGHAVANE